MWLAPALAGATTVALSMVRPAALVVAAPVLALWLLSPAIVWWLSRPLQRRPSDLNAAQNRFLRLLARRTWSFFDTFVGPADHWLPPDNVQEHPVPRIAHRTSPTNIGFSLLANLAAYDFGYLTVGQLIARTSATFDTMEALERYESHFYNWYDTQSLQPLHPAYVSTVDSGNLAGHLLTLRGGLQALAAEMPQLPRLFAGLADTAQLLRQASTEPAAGSPLMRFESLLSNAQAAPPQEPHTLWPAFDGLARCAAELLESMGPPAPSPPAPLAGDAAELPTVDEARRWAEALDRQCRAALAELQLLSPAAAQPVSPTAAAWDEPALLARRTMLLHLAARAGALAEMDYGFLYDPARHLMAIGYNVDERRRDSGYYDLLASEIRLCSFVAVAQGKVPQETWFALGRLLTTVDGEPILLSWSGSMFEYLMPLLVMPSYENTLLDQTMHAAVAAADRLRPPARRALGHLGVGLQRDRHRAELPVPRLRRARPGPEARAGRGPGGRALRHRAGADGRAPGRVRRTCERLADEGLAGPYGFYEAIDYTPARVPRGRSSAVVRSFMAHHQGMSLLALAYLLLDQPMQRRFEADPQLQATLLLLQERIPKAVAFHPHTAERAELRPTVGAAETPLRLFTTPDTPAPEVHLLSNGRYHVMVTNAGGGYSRWKDLAVTRWREDATSRPLGQLLLPARRRRPARCWSSTYQPTACEARRATRPSSPRAAPSSAAATSGIETPHRDRRLARRRHRAAPHAPDQPSAARRRSIELTSYAEVVLAPRAADAPHPAFSNLFVQTEIVRRPARAPVHAPAALAPTSSRRGCAT